MANRVYTARHEIHNKGDFRGIEAYAEVWIEDQWHVVHADAILYRRNYKTTAAFKKAIRDTEEYFRQRRLA